MQIERLVEYLDDAATAEAWLTQLGLEDRSRAHTNLVAMAESGLTLDLMAVICQQLDACMPALSDPDMALNNLERYLLAARNPLSLGSLLERDPEALPTLLQIFSTSQFLADLLIRDPAGFDLLRMTEGQPVGRQILADEIRSEVEGAQDEESVLHSLRRYRHRETLRIAYGDIVRTQPIETVTRQISYLADAICDAALYYALAQQQEKYGVPRRPDGQPARLVALGLGKLGGVELNYSSDIDLVFLCDDDEGKTDGTRSISTREFFDRTVRHFVKLLSESTDLGVAYRVDLRLRPEGNQGPAVIKLEAALNYYDNAGRTWERQAFVKARPIAGDRDLGRQFLERLEPWIYRQYLSRADITGIKALKRRIEQRARQSGVDSRDVKTGHGGIRDIEFVIQFLQLLNGGDLPEIRTTNTLQAILALESVGCLTMQERSLLEENYAFLRKVEHRLQVMFDLQTHTIPEQPKELRKLAIRTGFRDASDQSALEQFQAELKQKTQLNRKILDHLLHDAFEDEEDADREVDLVLDPNPDADQVAKSLSGYGFQDVDAAYRNLQSLATERIPFLSTRRCRHFLAAIAPALLKEIALTPDPDLTLVNLSKVSDSLGGKGVLWELFSFNAPTLKLYVRMCGSPYLSGILTSNPGMIDYLMDSLLLNRLPSYRGLQARLDDLSRGAEQLDPILHSFKSAQHLRVGVHDILGKEDIYDIHRALSDVAEVCVQRIAAAEYPALVQRFGVPQQPSLSETAEGCEFVILAMGKLGGREPNYHSDLDVMFLYEHDGTTQTTPRIAARSSTSNQHFFSEWGQRLIKVITRLGPFGRLYEMDPRLRPTGKSGSLAVARHEFERYFESGQGQLWERQALCKARPIFGTPTARQRVMQSVHDVIRKPGWKSEDAREIRKMRARLEETASPANLKRGLGGTVDIEFTVQMLQLKHCQAHPEVLTPGTLDALRMLEEINALNSNDAVYLAESYRFLRGIETGLRLMNTAARHDLPDDRGELCKLAYVLDRSGPDELQAECDRYRKENRARFERFFA